LKIGFYKYIAFNVENKVIENILHLASEGRYAVGPIYCLPWGVLLNNIMAILNAMKKWGVYPINFNSRNILCYFFIIGRCT